RDRRHRVGGVAPAEIAATIAGAPRHRLVSVPGCAHEFKPATRAPLDAEGVAGLLATGVREFLPAIDPPAR
ncbi:MAG: hypothetical protein Q4F67_13485, partial [Propionibacteriaceae bacterium]|nr:hypothetical protein [Propionibacteriaceae bacterium]